MGCTECGPSIGHSEGPGHECAALDRLEAWLGLQTDYPDRHISEHRDAYVSLFDLREIASRFRAALAPTCPAPQSSLTREQLEDYYSRQIEWSRKTFGPGKRTGGILQHIRKELAEIEAQPADLSEWIDAVILAMDGYWRHGGTAQSFMPDLLAKQAKNFSREWPTPTSEDMAVEHVRESVAGSEDTRLKEIARLAGEILDSGNISEMRCFAESIRRAAIESEEPNK